MNQYHKELLTTARDGRIREFTEYQVNIDNYRLAIVKIGADPELQDFKAQLEGLLSSSLLEQKKSKVILDVIQDQLGESHAV